MDPYLYALISTYVPEQAELLTSLARGKIIKEIKDGNTYANGALHSFDDKPVKIKDGILVWYKFGKKHRDDDLPAKIFNLHCPTQVRVWYKRGKIHRDNDLPAVMAAGYKIWYQNGRKHRDNDLPAVIRADGTEMWFRKGKWHRDEGQPAVIKKYSRVKIWATRGTITNVLENF